MFHPNQQTRQPPILTPWCRVLLEKLTGLQLVKKFQAFYGTRRFITALTSVRHLSLSWANPIQSIYPHPTSWRSILILFTHLRLGLPSGFFPSGCFPTKTLYTPLSSPIRATCPVHLIDIIILAYINMHIYIYILYIRQTQQTFSNIINKCWTEALMDDIIKSLLRLAIIINMSVLIFNTVTIYYKNLVR